MDYEKVKHLFGNWAEKFKPFIESEEFDKITEKLRYDSKELNRRILPKADNIFKIFEKFDENKLKVVFFLQDPYPSIIKNKPVSNGIALDCSNTGILQPSLEKFYEGIEECYETKVNREPNLDYYLEQGVMLLNSELTVEAKKPGSHKGLWEPFMKYFIEEIINKYHNGTIFVFSGKSSESLRKYMSPFMHYEFIIEHPSAAARMNREWKHNDVFKSINTILLQNNGADSQINWIR